MGNANMKEQCGGASRWWLMAGSINMLLAVALGAFGAHALKASLPPDLMAVYQTGNQYHIYHALGSSALVCHQPSADPVSGCHLGGALLFSGSLYALSLTGRWWIGMFTLSAARPSWWAGCLQSAPGGP
jgi:uncharacterized membrane protein YgdD (TMEM256/DUF423 family)